MERESQVNNSLQPSFTCKQEGINTSSWFLNSLEYIFGEFLSFEFYLMRLVLMSIKRYRNLFLLSLIVCWGLFFSDFFGKPWAPSALPQYEEPFTWGISTGFLEEPRAPLGTPEDYARRIFVDAPVAMDSLQLLPKFPQTGAFLKFYANKDWNFSLLAPKNVAPHQESLRKIPSPYDWFDLWEDEEYYYLYSNNSQEYRWFANKKSALPNFKLLGFLGEHAIDAFFGYSDGYIVIPPYLLPVDQNTYIPPQTPGSGGIQDRQFFRNGGKQYTNYLWSDKDWVYRWNKDNSFENYLLLREKRKSDFKLLTGEEIQEFFNLSHIPWVQLHPKNQEKRWISIDEGFGRLPELWHFGDRMYVFWVHGNWSFPIDGASMQRTEKEIPNNENHTTYFTLSDNNYFYQLVYHNEGDFYELQRIKR